LPKRRAGGVLQQVQVHTNVSRPEAGVDRAGQMAQSSGPTGCGPDRGSAAAARFLEELDGIVTHSHLLHAPTLHAPTLHAPTLHAPTLHAPTLHAPAVRSAPIPARTSTIGAVLLLLATASVAHPQAAPDATDQASRLVEAGRYQEAKPLLLDLTRREPGNVRAAYLAGRTLVALDDPDPAAKQLERAVQREPRNAEYVLWLGRAYGLQAQRAGTLRQAGLARKTRETFERVLALHAENLDARGHLIEFHLRAPGIVGGDRRRALAYAEEIASRDPYRGALELARVHVAMNNRGGAERTLAAAVSAFPDSAAPRLSLSMALQDAGRFDAAYDVLVPLLATRRHARALFMVGRIGAVSGQQLDRAERALRDYLALQPASGEPTHAAAHTRLGDIMRHRGDNDAARSAYQAALRLEPRYQPALDGMKQVR
jgi:tetratricopeptide (TPR) repeat protein